jgi:hypothetical protein
MITFDLEDIMDLATQSSYKKGEEYYNRGFVNKIVKKGNVYESTVKGSSLYSVYLDTSENELDFFCDCPYDYEGICKHSVALALAVLKGDVFEKSENIFTENSVITDSFNDCYINTDTLVKLNFLTQLLKKDTDLQNQFVKFTEKKYDDSKTIFYVEIDKIAENVRDKLSCIDFDDIADSYNPYDGGYYDDEGNIDEAYEAIRNVLNPFVNEAINYIRKGNLIDGINVVLGLYEGIQNLPEINNNEYEIFYNDYDDEVFTLFLEVFDTILKAIEQIIKSEEQIKEVFDVIFERFNLFLDKNDSLMDSEIIYEMDAFEGLFKILLINKETAHYLFSLIQENDLECFSMAFVLLKIAEITENESLWIENAETYAELNSSIIMQLMEKYKSKDDTENFNRISKLAFEKFPEIVSSYLIENLDKEKQENLYVQALKYYTIYKQSITHYYLLRNYFTEEQKITFVDNLNTEYKDAFYISLLEIEVRYADILNFAIEKEKLSKYFDFNIVLKPILNIYPNVCFRMIKNNCDNYLKSLEKNRKTYSKMAEILKLMIQIKTMQTESKEYITSLYNHKPNLPALRDEFRKHLGEHYFK